MNDCRNVERKNTESFILDKRLLWIQTVFLWARVANVSSPASHRTRVWHKSISLWELHTNRVSFVTGVKIVRHRRHFPNGTPQAPSNELSPASKQRPVETLAWGQLMVTFSQPASLKAKRKSPLEMLHLHFKDDLLTIYIYIYMYLCGSASF